MKRRTLLLLSLVAVGAILWIAVFGSSGTAPTREKPATERTTPRRKPKLRLAGHVQTKDGRPVAGATVFVLPKKHRGLNRDRADHEVTGADGRWALRTRKTVDCWIGVVAPGYRNAYLDGDTVDPSVQMFLVVEPAPAITVTLKDAAGTPIRGKGVQVLPWPDSGAFYYLPGPKARQGEQWRVTDDAGQAVFRRGDQGPVTITPDVEGMHAGSPDAWLPATQGAVAFTLHPMGSLELKLKDAATGAALPGLVTVEFFDPEKGATFFSLTESATDQGIVRLERAVPRGRYGVHVFVEDRRPYLCSPVEVQDGNTSTLDVACAPAQARGTLTLALSGNKAVVPAGARRRAPLTFLRRTDAGFGIRGWSPGAPDWDRAGNTLAFDLSPGTYDVLVADVVSGRAALESGLVLAPGAKPTLEVVMRPGQRGKLPSLRAAGHVTRGLAVEDETGRRLPVFGGTRGGRARAARELDVIRRALDGAEIFLGPYPFDEFTLTLLRSDGARAKKVFR